MSIKQLVSGAAAAIAVAIGMPLSALAASNTVTVTQQNQQGWSTTELSSDATIKYITDATSPAPNGALQLITGVTTTSKAQYLHAANTPLTDITSLSYYTKQVSASFAQGDASYQLPVCLLGVVKPSVNNPSGCNGYTTLVFEPYYNGTVTPQAWQKWDVYAGQLWSSRLVSSGTCSTIKGNGGAPFYSLAALKTACPNAVVGGFGVNIGSNNPSYNVETDLVNFNGTTYDFQIINMPTNKDQCKKDGYLNYTDGSAVTLKNQGSCVSYVNDASSTQSESEFQTA